MGNPKITEDLVDRLRAISKDIEDRDISVSFPAPERELAADCPFVDRACEAIEHGGTLEAPSLASLIHYLADMMEE